MSNASDFFSGGGGGSIPIGGVLPINYSGNLYITTQEQEWLKTGKVLTNIEDYPDAARTILTGTDLGSLANITEGTDFDGMLCDFGFIYCLDNNTDTMFKYTLEGSYTGISWPVTSGNNKAIASNGTYIYVLNTAHVLTVYQPDGTVQEASRSLIIPQGFQELNAINWDGSHWWVTSYVATGGSTQSEVYRYTSSFVFDTVSFVLSTADMSKAIEFEGNNILVQREDADWYKFDKTTGALVGKALDVTAAPSSVAGFIKDSIAYHITDAVTQQIRLTAYKLSSVGLELAKTDSDTGLPIFIRIK
tara:strand:- start:181 stop:1092 length:912 start_codon:yes stop_codon:yes gene_type:complete